MGMSCAHFSQLVNYKVLELFVGLVLYRECISGFLRLRELAVNDTDMVCNYIHNLPLYLLHLCNISLTLDASVHRFQLLDYK